MASTELRTKLLEWTESDVHSWLSSIGFPQYETQIRGGHPPTLLFFQRTDPPVSHQRITSQAMSSLSSTPIHSRRLESRRSVSDFRFSNTYITPNSPTTSPSNRITISLLVCPPHVKSPRLKTYGHSFCSRGRRQARWPKCR